jgi:beta-galactosidase GanA
MTAKFPLPIYALFLVAFVMVQDPLAKADGDSIPHIVQRDGRYALFVDGAPYLMLGAQVNNSSGWPSVLPKVWPAMEFMHVNTVEIPIYWEQFEPEYGTFDYSVLDTLLDQARGENVHLVLLWFGTWKNGSNHYMPKWMKLDPDRYPNMIGADGKYIDSPSPVAKDTLTADIQAFTTLMRHLKEADPEHSVLMVQVENEPGVWDGVRDYSPAAQKLFDGVVPAEVLAAMGKTNVGGSPTWHDAFGDNADEYFQVWCVSKFIGQVAAAGKTVYPLPMYVNASVRDPLKRGRSPGYECGGPNDNVFPIWKAEAPAVDLLAPDIYQRNTAKYLKLLDLYQRPDNPLFVPETMGQGAYARFFFAALGHGAIGYSPFGLD